MHHSRTLQSPWGWPRESCSSDSSAPDPQPTQGTSSMTEVVFLLAPCPEPNRGKASNAQRLHPQTLHAASPARSPISPWVPEALLHLLSLLSPRSTRSPETDPGDGREAQRANPAASSEAAGPGGSSRGAAPSVVSELQFTAGGWSNIFASRV